MKKCIDCKYFVQKNKSWFSFGSPNYLFEKDKCSHPMCAEPIRGDLKAAELCRMFECGMQARFFEEK